MGHAGDNVHGFGLIADHLNHSSNGSSRGTQAEVIAINGDGWAQIRLIEGGASGWMAARLLGDN